MIDDLHRPDLSANGDASAGEAARQVEHRRDLRLDFTTVGADLPERLRLLMHRLMSESPSEVAHARGVARQRIADDIALIRSACRRRGLTGAC
ncbi:MAG: hypothetical protein H0T76_07495 [Nannocystis sp.]|nr:hypothetical protein [Nannocystis sp.]